MYLVLSTAPKTKPTGEVVINQDGEEIRIERVIHWPVIGRLDVSDEAAAMALAKERWGGSPVLEHITPDAGAQANKIIRRAMGRKPRAGK